MATPGLKLYYRLTVRGTRFRWGSRIYPGTALEGYNTIGRGSYVKGSLGYGTYLSSNSTLIAEVGRYCSIGEQVMCLINTHPVERFVTTHPSFYSLKQQAGFTLTSKQRFDEYPTLPGSRACISIGHDVYLGYGVTIIGPVRIGDGAVVAANSTVTKDVEPYTIVGGTPAKVIRPRFTPEQVAFLKSFRWWDRDLAWLRANVEAFSDIDEFCRRFSAQESHGDNTV